MKYFEIIYTLGGVQSKTVLESPNRLDAVKKFQDKPLGALLSIDEINEPFSKKFEKLKDSLSTSALKRKIPLEPYIASLRQLSVMLDAGIPINHCFSEIISMTEHKQTKEIFKQISLKIESGSGITDAFEDFSYELGNVSPAIISLGEQTGQLSEAVEKLANILDEIHENRKKLKKAMRYPLIVITIMIAAFVAVIKMIVPQFKTMFEEYDSELPYPTQILLGIESFMKEYGIIIVIGIVIIVLIHTTLYHKNKKYKYTIDKYSLKLYLFGRIQHLSMTGRFLFVFDKLTNSGVPITKALDISKNIVENDYIKERFSIMGEAIEEGRSLTDGFKESGQFESITIQMIKAGESSGSLNKMLEKVNNYYSVRYNDLVDNISTYIEPIMIALIAAFITLLALGIFLPMWSMADAID